VSRAVDAITPISLAAVIFLGCLLLVLPRRYAFLPMLIGGCYMTLGQALIVGGLHFYLIRILILFGFARIVLRGEVFRVRPNRIDKLLLAWLAVSSFLYILVDGTDISPTERLGYAYNAVGIYVLVRATVTSLDDAIFVVKACAVLVIPLALLFVAETRTGENLFARLGGVPFVSEVRDGRIRAQGAFRHPILAGTFAATAMPLFAGLWASGSRLLATCAIAATATIVIASASSGAFAAFIMASVGLCCWGCREHMRAMRWGILMFLVLLDVYMKAPIWFLIDRLSSLVGGEGWYRSALIDAAIRHLNEWWLVGTGRTAHWMPTGIVANANSADLVNEFVAQGVQGGLLAVALFVWLIVASFKVTGQAVRGNDQLPLRSRFAIWSIGCALLAHVTSFFSVSYFDQISIFWYMTIGMIATLMPEPQTHKAAVPLAAGTVPLRLASVSSQTVRARRQAGLEHISLTPRAR
jgi:hypothetical protein